MSRVILNPTCSAVGIASVGVSSCLAGCWSFSASAVSAFGLRPRFLGSLDPASAFVSTVASVSSFSASASFSFSAFDLRPRFFGCGVSSVVFEGVSSC